MGILKGTDPHLLDRRDRSLIRTFPLIAGIPGDLPLMDYTFDAGLAMPDQATFDNRFIPPIPPLPYGCTGYTATDICGDEDKATYDPKYTYERTCDMELHDYTQGCQIRTSLRSLTVYGLRKNGEMSAQAELRKRGAYYFVEKISGRDWFDTFRLCLRGHQRSISVATPWFDEWSHVGTDGRLSNDFYYDGIMSHYTWHNTKVCGEKVLFGGIPVLRVKSWQGERVGDKGWLYWDRETFNKAFDNYGTIAGTPGEAVKASDIKFIKITLYQQALVYLNALLAILGKRVPIYA